MIAALVLLIQTAAAPLPAPSDEVVVVATRRLCSVSIADRILSSREFDERSAEWARGVPVRVVAPAGSDYRCLTRIMFKLAARGVTRAEFVDR